MNLNNLFEGAIEELEKRRIEDLEAKMDDYAARAKQTKDPKVIAAYRHEFAKAKAERDSYHYVNEEGTDTTAFDRKGNKVPVYIPTKDEDELEEHGGGGGGPAQWHAYVKAHRTDEWSNSAAGEPEQTDLERVVDEGWSDKHNPVPYGVYINGKQWKEFPTDDHARAVANKLEAKLKAEGRPGVVTFAPSEAYTSSLKEAANPAQQAAIAINMKKAHKKPKTDEALRDPWNEKYFGPGEVIQKMFKVKADNGKSYNVKAATEQEAKDTFQKHAPGTNILSIKFVSNQVNEIKKGAKDSNGNTGCWDGYHAQGTKKGKNGGQVRNCVPNESIEESDDRVDPIIIKALERIRPGIQGNTGPGSELYTAAKEALALEFGLLQARNNSTFVNYLNQLQDLYRKRNGVKEETMDQAAHNPDGPKFGGYYKGTQVGAPRPGQSFGAESKEMREGAKVDRMVQHIKKSEKATGKSAKDAEAIAWATANKRGYLDNANKKKHTTEEVDNSHATNFLSWVLNQGSRFRGFLDNPETYAKAKEAYKREHGAEPTFAEGMSNALSNITRRIAQPVNAKTIIKNREQKKDSIKRQHFAEDDVNEMFGPEWQAVGGALNFAKEHGIPMMAFAAVAAAYGISKAAKELEQGENRFKKIAAKAVKAVDKNIIHKMANKLHELSSKAMAEEYKPVTRPVPQPRKLNPGWALDPTTKAELKRRKDVRNRVGVDEDWQKANKKDKTDGMSQKAVNAYKRENPGSKLKTAVTTKPSKLKKGSKDSKRRKSYCARSAGQKKMHNIDCSKTPDKAICKARRRWNCESQEQFDAMLREAVEKGTLQPGQYYVWTVHFDDGSSKKIKVTKDTFDPKAYYAKKNQVVINVDYDWVAHNG